MELSLRSSKQKCHLTPSIDSQDGKMDRWAEVAGKEQLPCVYEACGEHVLVGSVRWEDCDSNSQGTFVRWK